METTEEYLPKLSVPAGGHIAFAWGVGNQLAVFGSKGRGQQAPSRGSSRTGGSGTTTKTTGAVAGRKTSVGIYAWDIFQEWDAPLLTESHGVFMALQHAAREAGESQLSKEDVVAASRHYRAILQAQVLSLDEQVASGLVDASGADNVSTLYSSAELIWHLVEVFFLNTPPSGLIAPLLVEWLHLHTPLDPAILDVAQAANPVGNDEFWAVLYRLIIQGRIETATELLGSLSTTDDVATLDALTVLAEALGNMPLLAPGTPLSEHLPAWKGWHDSVRSVLDTSPSLTEDPRVSTAFLLLLGDNAVLGDKAESWYELLIARMLFVDPTIKVADVRAHTRSAIAAVEGSVDNLRNVDLILLAIMDGDIHTAIRYCVALLGSAWFVAHLTDVLSHAGAIESFTLDFGTSLREYFLLEYGIKLMSSRQHWQLAATYFSHAPVLGSNHLAALLTTTPHATAPQTAKLLNLASFHGLVDVAASIRCVRGRAFLARGSLVSALIWYLRARNTAAVSAVANALVDTAIEPETLASLHLLDNLGADLIVSEHLAFLAKYRQFVLLRNAGELGQAAGVLVKLLSSHIVPRRHVFSLLKEAVPLLEAPDAVIGAQETYALMAVLSDASHDHRSRDFVPDALTVQALSLALSRNLSRSLLDAPAPTAPKLVQGAPAASGVFNVTVSSDRFHHR